MLGSIWRMCFSSDSLHIYGYKLCFSSHRLYSYEANFIPGLLKKDKTKLTRSFNFTLCYIDDFFSLNNSRYGDFVDLSH
jgi:hypothetical protein